MSKPKCGHTPPKGFRELAGAELEEHFKQMEKAGYMIRRRHTGKRRPNLKGTCLHVYVKI